MQAQLDPDVQDLIAQSRDSVTRRLEGRALTSAVANTQHQAGQPCRYRGSWDPVDAWSPEGGRVYATAILAMCLQVYYRYDKALPCAR